MDKWDFKMIVNYWKLFKEALALDIYDLTYEYSSEIPNKLAMASAALPRKGIPVRILSFFLQLLKSLRKFWQRKQLRIPEKSFIFFVLSKNEKDSLYPVYSKMTNGYLTGEFCEATNNLNLFYAYTLSLLFFPFVVVNYIKSHGYEKKSYSYIFDKYWLVFGLYIVSRIWLERLKPKAFIISNHYAPYNRAVLKAAKDEHIPTFYIQHASVNESFPPLDFDFALLEGYVSLNKYVLAGATQTQVFLIGMPKLDPHFKDLNIQSTIKSIGICTNGLDPIASAEALCKKLQEEFPNLSITLRPHPSDRRVKEWIDLATKYNLIFSSCKKELSFEFLKNIDVIIAGDSNILLEAALLDVFPMYYDFGHTCKDVYSFLHNGLVQYYSEPSEICRFIAKILQNKPSVKMNAKPYCATIGSSYEGKSSVLASALIETLVYENKAALEGWKRIPNVPIEAYELGQDYSDI